MPALKTSYMKTAKVGWDVTSVYNALKKLVPELSIAHRMVCGCRRLVD